MNDINQELTHEEIVCQILDEFDLNWEVEKIQNKYEFVGVQKNSSSYALVNATTGDEISVVSKSYVPTQNYEVVDLILRALKGLGNYTINNATVFNGGKRIFYQIYLEGYQEIGLDQVKPIITVIDSNDRSASLAIGIGNKVKSCNNEFWAFYDRAEFKFRHNLSMEEKLKLLPKALTEGILKCNDLMTEFNEWAYTYISDRHIHEMVEKVLQPPSEEERTDPETGEIKDHSSNMKNKLELLYECITNETAEKGKTLWGLFNGVTLYTTHHATHPKRKNGDLESSVGGNNSRLNARAYQYCKKVYETSE